MLLSLFAIMLFFQVMTDGTLLQPLNLTNLVLQNSYIVIMALGMLLVIVTGHIDLSVGSVAGFVGAVAAVLMVRYQVDYHAGLHRLPRGRRGDRRGAGLLGRLFQASRPSSSRWPACWCSRALRWRCCRASRSGRSRRPSRSCRSGFIPELLPDAGTLHPTSLLIGAVLALALVYASAKSRAREAVARHRGRALCAFFVGKSVVLAVRRALFHLSDRVLSRLAQRAGHHGAR